MVQSTQIALDASGSDGLVAQSVEQRPFKPLVEGSSPSQPTTSTMKCKYVGGGRFKAVLDQRFGTNSLAR